MVIYGRTAYINPTGAQMAQDTIASLQKGESCTILLHVYWFPNDICTTNYSSNGYDILNGKDSAAGSVP